MFKKGLTQSVLLGLVIGLVVFVILLVMLNNQSTGLSYQVELIIDALTFWRQ